MQKILSLALLSLVALSGCLTGSSENRKTEDIRVVYVATKSGNDEIRLEVQAYDKRSTLSWIDSLPFSSGDEFVVTDGTSTIRFGGTTGVLDSDAAGITVSLERAEATDAPESIISFPAPFELATIPTQVSRAEELAIRWSPAANDPALVDARGDCIDRAFKHVGPGASSVFLSIEAKADLPPDVSCQIDLSLTVSRRGTVDKALGAGSKAMGQQVRRATFKSVP